jgi:hypothetical protein
VRKRGLSSRRNAALAAARAPLVSELDANDAWEPDYLESILPSFDDPAIGLAYSNPTAVDRSLHEFPSLAERCPVPRSTATMRTVAVRAVGGYARWLRHGEDHHLYMKLARAGWRFAHVNRSLARHRRGLTEDLRRHELWELGMFASFVAAHPRTPGPRRQVRARLRRELERVRARV